VTRNVGSAFRAPLQQPLVELGDAVVRKAEAAHDSVLPDADRAAYTVARVSGDGRFPRVTPPKVQATSYRGLNSNFKMRF
jgi:hypothetical protein